MRRTIKEIEVNVAFRWFLGLELYDKVPHFSTFGKTIQDDLKVLILKADGLERASTSMSLLME